MVFLGGGLGSLARYGVARLMPPAELADGEIPWFTLVANVMACIVLGVGIGLLSKEQLSRPLQLLLLTGFCGGFSTFSTFSYETFALLRAGANTLALVNVALSLVLGLVAIALGFFVMNRVL